MWQIIFEKNDLNLVAAGHVSPGFLVVISIFSSLLEYLGTYLPLNFRCDKSNMATNTFPDILAINKWKFTTRNPGDT